MKAPISVLHVRDPLQGAYSNIKLVHAMHMRRLTGFCILFRGFGFRATGKLGSLTADGDPPVRLRDPRRLRPQAEWLLHCETIAMMIRIRGRRRIETEIQTRRNIIKMLI